MILWRGNEGSAVLQSFGPLICLWAAVLSMSAVGATALQVLGPPARVSAGSQRVGAPAAASLVEAAQPLVAGIPVEPLLIPPPPQPEVTAMPDAAPAPRPKSAPRRGEAEDAPRPRSLARRSPLPPETIKAPFAQPAPLSPAPSYIGIYGVGTDGTRTFRSAP